MNKGIIIKTVTAYIFLFAVNTFHALFYIPFLLRQLGSEAYAYYPLSLSVINFTSVLTVITASMLSAFLIRDYRAGNIVKVNEFINSSLFGNIITVSILALPLILFCLYSGRILNVPKRLSGQVKFLFLPVTAAFLIAQIRNSFTVIFQSSGNKYLINSQKAFEKGAAIAISSAIFSWISNSLIPVGISILTAGILRFIITIRTFKKIFPQFEISKKYIKKDISVKLFYAGAGNCLSQLIFLLSVNSGTVLSNILFGPSIQSIYSLGGQLPYLFGLLLIYLMNSYIFFLAVSMKNGDMENIRKDTVSVLGITARFLGIISAVFCAFGDIFLKIWLNIHYNESMYTIMVLYSLSFMINGSFYVIYSTIVVINKVKLPAVFMIITETISIAATVITAELSGSMYSIAAVYLAKGILQFAVFIPAYFSKKTNTDIRVIYRKFLSGIISFGTASLISFTIKLFFLPDGFLSLLAAGISAASVSVFASLFFGGKSDLKVAKKIIKANTEYRNDLNELQSRDYDSLL